MSIEEVLQERDTMGFSVGIVGKPSCGKTSFTNAACKTDFKVGSYPFTTIEANVGVTHIRTACACTDFDVVDNPKNSICIDGVRLVPIKLIDVAGLVPGAHEGRGMGNQFLDDLRQADVLIHIVDASGALDSDGQEVGAGSQDPADDVRFLEEELVEWMLDIVKKDWRRVTGRVKSEGAKLDELLLEKLSGLKITRAHILMALRKSNLKPENVDKWTDDETREFVKILQQTAKPIIIAANKIDRPGAEENYKRLQEEFPDYMILPVSALAEKALKDLDQKGVIKYIPGNDDFEVVQDGSLKEAESVQLEKLRENLLKKYGGTGVQNILNKAVFDFLHMITIYPVHDANALTDSDENVLPDVFLVPEGTTAKEFAGHIHTDLMESFVHGIDARTKMRISDKHVLKDRDVIKIVSAKGQK
ncbi:MAG: redox-regulated ATPase YchF [Candidatus Thorarchaeota archaeon]|nr:MAG: redox-regulated ATPase YchF [Candidatus Thorarchaeota archaeon]